MKKDVLLESFDNLYENGYRFIDSLDDFKVVEKEGHSEIHTSVAHINFLYKGEKVSREMVEKIFNYAGFLMSVKNKELYSK